MLSLILVPAPNTTDVNYKHQCISIPAKSTDTAHERENLPAYNCTKMSRKASSTHCTNEEPSSATIYGLGSHCTRCKVLKR